MKHIACLAFIVGAMSSVHAQPTGGFNQYKNPQTGKTQCSQSPISPDWVRVAGPFTGPDCKTAQDTQDAKPKQSPPALVQIPVSK